MAIGGGGHQASPARPFPAMRHTFAVAVLISSCLVLPPAWAADVPMLIGDGHIRTSGQSLQARRWRNVIKQGWDISCGTAALATILHFEFGDGVNEQWLLKSLLRRISQQEVRRRGGVSLLDLKRAAVERGYHATGYKLSLDQMVELNLPAIVPLTIRGSKHFVVFRGRLGDRVVLADPAFGNITMRDEQFTHLWRGVALTVTRQRPAGFAARLDVASDDILVADAPVAKDLIRVTAFHAVRGPDEF